MTGKTEVLEEETGVSRVSLSKLKLFCDDFGSFYDSLLILLANRFISAYYLLLITGFGPAVRPGR
ncbi:MAG: hypothetical protein WAN03_04955 [Candidatus Sulfotelmatobacter sp.]